MKYEIWTEGYRATGEHSTAQKIGESIGTDFSDAVKNYMSANPNSGIEEHGDAKIFNDELAGKRMREMNKPSFSIWGCNLFSNEKDARKSFG